MIIAILSLTNAVAVVAAVVLWARLHVARQDLATVEARLNVATRDRDLLATDLDALRADGKRRGDEYRAALEAERRRADEAIDAQRRVAAGAAAVERRLSGGDVAGALDAALEAAEGRR